MPSAKKSGETLKQKTPANTKGKADEKPAAKTSSKPRGDDRDRSIMDRGGEVNMFEGQANLDRQDAATAALDKALSTCKEIASTVTKSIAHAQSTAADTMKMACLDEIATLGHKLSDKARAAIRSAKKAQANAKPPAKPKPVKGAKTK